MTQNNFKSEHFYSAKDKNGDEIVFINFNFSLVCHLIIIKFAERKIDFFVFPAQLDALGRSLDEPREFDTKQDYERSVKKINQQGQGSQSSQGIQMNAPFIPITSEELKSKLERFGVDDLFMKKILSSDDISLQNHVKDICG